MSDMAGITEVVIVVVLHKPGCLGVSPWGRGPNAFFIDLPLTLCI